MSNIKRDVKNTSFKMFLVFLAIFTIIVPLLTGSLNFTFISNTFTSYDTTIFPKTSDFSKDNFTEIISEEKSGLGNITISNMDMDDLEMGIYIYNDSYPLIWDDIESNALNITRSDFKFIETINPAIQDNLNKEVVDTQFISVKLIESLTVRYNNPQVDYLIYHSRLYPAFLLELYVNNGTDNVELELNKHYTIDGHGFIKFNNYTTYFQKGPIFNFDMYFTWEYEVRVNSWRIVQDIKQVLIENEKEQNLTASFNYAFTLSGQKFSDDISDPNIVIHNIYFAFVVNLPDKNLLFNHSLELNGNLVNNFLTTNKTIETSLTDLFHGNQSRFSLNFTAEYTLGFIYPVGETWAIDRLYAKTNNRERIYFPSLISGPKHIILKYLTLQEPTIYFEQILSNYSLFERDVAFFDINFTATGKRGVNIMFPYLIVGETCPFTIKYKTSQILRVVITDNIRMPITGVTIEVYYYGQQYGTFISAFKVQPIALAKSNENGEILLQNVPHGNYTIKVYHTGDLVKEGRASTYVDKNIIRTNIPHFPLWILIFGTLNGCILIIGAIYYVKHKNKR